MKRHVCQCCGQSVENVREGVRLTPLKARIFDLIKARPGITQGELCWIVYGVNAQAGQWTIGAHVHQIRNLLKGTGVIVQGVPHNGYSVRERGKR